MFIKQCFIEINTTSCSFCLYLFCIFFAIVKGFYCCFFFLFCDLPFSKFSIYFCKVLLLVFVYQHTQVVFLQSVHLVQRTETTGRIKRQRPSFQKTSYTVRPRLWLYQGIRGLNAKMPCLHPAFGTRTYKKRNQTRKS